MAAAGEHERRYAIFQVSESKRQDRSWFQPLYEQMENGGYGAMLHDLLQLDLGDWHPRNIPATEALRQQQERSIKPLDAWVLEYLEEGVLPRGESVAANRALSYSKTDVDGRNPRNGLFDEARQRVPTLKRIGDPVLAAHLRDKFGCTPWRSNLARGWEFPPLRECRKKWEEGYPNWSWRHPDLTEWQDDNDVGRPWPHKY
jgi:hypothetical protein